VIALLLEKEAIEGEELMDVVRRPVAKVATAVSVD
jgi:hypothetical protein